MTFTAPEWISDLAQKASSHGITLQQLDLAACTAHEANRRYCLGLGDSSQPAWDDAPEWQVKSLLNGVIGVLEGNGPGASHASWLAEKEADGWVYGPVKDPEHKLHPCMVPFTELPVEQRMKDVLFVNVVRAVLDAVRGPV